MSGLVLPLGFGGQLPDLCGEKLFVSRGVYALYPSRSQFWNGNNNMTKLFVPSRTAEWVF